MSLLLSVKLLRIKLITFELTICERCERFCFCDYCNLPDYNDRRSVIIDNQLEQNLKVLNKIINKFPKDRKPHVILGGIGEPGLANKEIIEYIFNNIQITMISTTGRFLEKYLNYCTNLPISLHIAVPEDEYLISKYKSYINKAWTIFSDISDLGRYSSELYDVIYLEGNPKTYKFDGRLLQLNLSNIDKPNISNIEQHRSLCRKYTPYVTINLTRNTIAMCSCYNSFIQIPFNEVNLVKVLCSPVFDSYNNTDIKCHFCFRNCYGLLQQQPFLTRNRLYMNKLFRFNCKDT